MSLRTGITRSRTTEGPRHEACTRLCEVLVHRDRHRLIIEGLVESPRDGVRSEDIEPEARAGLRLHVLLGGKHGRPTKAGAAAFFINRDVVDKPLVLARLVTEPQRAHDCA